MVCLCSFVLLLQLFLFCLRTSVTVLARCTPPHLHGCTVSFAFACFALPLRSWPAARPPPPPRWHSLALPFPLLNQEKLGRVLLSNAKSLASCRQLWGGQSAFPLVLRRQHQLVHLSNQSHVGCEREGARMGRRSCVIYARPTHLEKQ